MAAEKRLKVLQSLDSLGAGFMLASHDLDMRGGGNLLGDEQSGHIRKWASSCTSRCWKMR
jgi:transcription-repair coupling factor (superfamily II helicase)